MVKKTVSTKVPILQNMGSFGIWYIGEEMQV